jgi:hypothetical protein
MDAPRPKFSCAVCGRLDTIVMGERGPVRTPLEFTEIGNFRFCHECLADADVGGGRITRDVIEDTVVMRAGPWKGHTWITAVHERHPK